jgi:hypothetical protein
MVNRIEFLQEQYLDGRSKWWAAGPSELCVLRDHMFRLAGSAGGWVGEDGAPLAQSMRILASAIDDHLSAKWPPGLAFPST